MAIKSVIAPQTTSNVITCADLRAMDKPKVFVYDEENDRAYIGANPSAGFYLVNLETQDVRWKAKESFDKLCDSIAKKGLRVYVYDDLDDLQQLITQFQNGDLC